MSQGWGRGTGNLGSRSRSKVADRAFLPHLPQLPSFSFYVSVCHILLAWGFFFFFFNKQGLPETPTILVKF